MGTNPHFAVFLYLGLFNLAAAIQGYMTLKVGVVTKDHKCEKFSLRHYRDMKHQHFYGP